jgi:hypothetical protein
MQPTSAAELLADFIASQDERPWNGPDQRRERFRQSGLAGTRKAADRNEAAIAR